MISNFFMTIEKYIYAIVAAVIAILAIALYITRANLKDIRQELTRVKLQYEQCVSKTNELNKTIAAYNDAGKKAGETIYQLRKLVMEQEEQLKNEEKSCNCYNFFSSIFAVALHFLKLRDSNREQLHNDGGCNIRVDT